MPGGPSNWRSRGRPVARTNLGAVLIYLGSGKHRSIVVVARRVLGGRSFRHG